MIQKGLKVFVISKSNSKILDIQQIWRFISNKNIRLKKESENFIFTKELHVSQERPVLWKIWIVHLVSKNYTFNSVPRKIAINSKNKKDKNINIIINSSEIYHNLLYYHTVFTLVVVLVILLNHCPCPSITHPDRSLHRWIKRSDQRRLITNSTYYNKCQSSRK